MKTAIYAGTFDPVTLGHVDVIRRATRLFDQVIVTIANNSRKQPLFTINERLDMLRSCTADISRVTCDSFQGLLIDFARKKGASALIRGLRTIADYEYEEQMAHVNRRLDEQMVTLFMMPAEQYAHINSSIVREVASYGGDVSAFVTPFVAEKLKMKFEAKH